MNKVPHLALPSSVPHSALSQHFLAKQIDIERWFRHQWALTPPPFYSSVDLRNAGFKLAPIDTNLFPAGFNNLNPAFMSLAVQAIQATLNQSYGGCQRILLLAENHTRNLNYFDSLARLRQMLVNAGFEAHVGAWREDLTAPQTVLLSNGRTLTIHALQHHQGRVGLENFSPCLVLLNNDLSEGVPPFLQNLEQTLLPDPRLGWSQRTKSQHFAYYQKLIDEFAQVVEIDPWCLAADFSTVTDIDFMSRQGEDALVDAVDALLVNIQRQYRRYGIEVPPYVVVKADAGTYGMGVMTVQKATDLRALNRKARTKMAATKGQKVQQVIVQEGVYSFEKIGAKSAEPVVYMIGSYVIGGFYRVHQSRGPTDNLNAPGMTFTPLMFAEACSNPDQALAPEASANLFYAYGVMARLAALAAAHEAAAL